MEHITTLETLARVWGRKEQEQQALLCKVIEMYPSVENPASASADVFWDLALSTEIKRD